MDRSAGSIPLISGHPALDFANTAGWHAGDHRNEWLTSYAELLAWARHAGALTAGAVRSLARGAAEHPIGASQALSRILDQREVVYRIFTAVAAGRPPSPSDLARLQAARVAALARAEPVWAPGRYLTMTWPERRRDLLRPAYPALLAATELLESGAFQRLRQCGNHPCGWLFIDTSRSGTRRWCTSSECGNASRVRRFRSLRPS